MVLALSEALHDSSLIVSPPAARFHHRSFRDMGMVLFLAFALAAVYADNKRSMTAEQARDKARQVQQSGKMAMDAVYAKMAEVRGCGSAPSPPAPRPSPPLLIAPPFACTVPLRSKRTPARSGRRSSTCGPPSGR